MDNLDHTALDSAHSSDDSDGPHGSPSTQMDNPHGPDTTAQDSALCSNSAEKAGTWSFSALVRAPEWDPVHFARVVEECLSALQRKKNKNMLANFSILSFACKDRNTVVPDGFVAVEGYLKTKGRGQVKRGTLWRRWKHPNLSIEWTPCLVGRRHYIDHDWIQTFHRETALPPAGVLQPPAGEADPRLRVDFLGPSDAPIDLGG